VFLTQRTFQAKKLDIKEVIKVDISNYMNFEKKPEFSGIYGSIINPDDQITTRIKSGQRKWT